MKRTPGPIKVYYPVDGRTPVTIGPVDSVVPGYGGSPGHVMFVVKKTKGALGDSKANAEHLAKCWNCHDELVAACLQAKLYLEDTDLDDEPEDGEYGDGKLALKALRNILAKAK